MRKALRLIRAFKSSRSSPIYATVNALGGSAGVIAGRLDGFHFRPALHVWTSEKTADTRLPFFTGVFAFVVVPPLIENPDVLGAFAAGFVNPYASGYSMDVLVCWAILAAWVVYEARQYSVRKGWVCLLLGIVPGVAVGFAVYLLIREKQLRVVRGDARE